MKTPTNKVLGFLLVVVFFVTAIISHSANQKRKDQNQPAEISLSTDSSLEIDVTNQAFVTDTDADGLSDWEEVLRGTNPGNPDSDGDGTNDGDEVAADRDPLVAGDDAIEDPEAKFIEKLSQIESPENSLTSQVAKQLLSQITQTGDSNFDYRMLDQFSTEIQVASIYKKENFITFEQDSEWDKNLPEFAKILVETQFKEIIGADKNLPVDEFAYIRAYENIAKRFSITAVPKDLLNIFTDFTNNFYKISVYAGWLTEIDDDPIKSILTIQSIENLSAENEKIMEQLVLYLQNNDIILDEIDLNL